jgi:3-keto-5-aminohexanoate cleavage enzyme
MTVNDTIGHYDREYVLTICPTGGVHGDEANPNHPVSHGDVVDQIEECYGMGAQVAHVHARDEEGYPTPSPERYEHLIGLINDRCPDMITQLGGLIGRYAARREDPLGEFLEDRKRLLDLDPAPDMLTINAGTFHVQNDPEVAEVLSPNSQEFNREFIAGAQERGMELEFEIWNHAQLYNIQQFFEEGLLSEPIHANFLVIPAGGMPPNLKHVTHYLQSCPFPVSSWQISGVGRAAIPTATLSLALGGNARTGMEDAAYIDRGEYVRDNQQMVDRVLTAGEVLNREPAPVRGVREEFAID